MFQRCGTARGGTWAHRLQYGLAHKPMLKIITKPSTDSAEQLLNRANIYSAFNAPFVLLRGLPPQQPAQFVSAAVSHSPPDIVISERILRI